MKCDVSQKENENPVNGMEKMAKNTKKKKTTNEHHTIAVAIIFYNCELHIGE